MPVKSLPVWKSRAVPFMSKQFNDPDPVEHRSIDCGRTMI